MSTSTKDFVPPPPKPGSIFALYKPPGSRRFYANVALSDGHVEQFDTETTVMTDARNRARIYTLKLCKDRGAPTPKDLRKKEGKPDWHERQTANRKAEEAGLPLPYPMRRKGHYAKMNGAPVKKHWAKPLPGKAPRVDQEIEEGIEEDIETALVKYGPMDRKWANFLDAHAKRAIIFMDSITRLIILGAPDDPQAFVDHCRALIIETMGTKGYTKRGRPPG